MSPDIRRVRQGDWIAALAAVVLFAAMFLDWYHLKGGDRTRFLFAAARKPLPPTGSAWEAFSNVELALVLLVAVGIALAAVRFVGARVEFPLSTVVGLYALLMLAVIAYKLFVHRPGGNDHTEVVFGGYLGLAAIIAITAGAALSARADRATSRSEPTGG